MTPGVLLAPVTGITIASVARTRRRRIFNVSAASGAVSLAFGLATSLALTAHIVSVALNGLAAHEPVVYDTEQISLLALGIAMLMPGLLCLSQARAVRRGELHAQKRTLAASIFIAGFTLPLTSAQPVAALLWTFAVVNIGVLLASRTNPHLTEPAAS